MHFAVAFSCNAVAVVFLLMKLNRTHRPLPLLFVKPDIQRCSRKYETSGD